MLLKNLPNQPEDTPPLTPPASVGEESGRLCAFCSIMHHKQVYLSPPTSKRSFWRCPKCGWQPIGVWENGDRLKSDTPPYPQPASGGG